MKTSELIKILKKNGCYLLRNGKKHDIWYSPKSENIFSVPRHSSKEIQIGTANNIMKDAGL
ncbi:MAG: type II toxin-antitoxin system HicA family toxin [Clostridiales bacterium]|nr:type II toxin-antitoxin system HicA family toxin [Clostridiales bacterium]